MKRYFEKLNIFSVVIFFALVSFFVANYKVEAAEIQIPENVSLYQALQDVPLKSGDNLLATIKKDTYLYLEQDTDALYIQYGFERIKVETGLFSKAAQTVGTAAPEYHTMTSDMKSSLDLNKPVSGLDPSNQLPVVNFSQTGSYPIYQESDSSYDALIGNRLISISKAALDTKTSTTSSVQPETPAQNNTNVTTTTGSTIQPSSVSQSISSTSSSFKGTEKYLKAVNNAVPVYLDTNGTNPKAAGELVAGQEYVIAGQLDSWIKVKFGNTFGYVKKSDVVPGNGASIKNLDNGSVNIDRYFKTYKSIPIYDNTSGSLVEFGKLEAGIQYPIIRQSSPNWLEIDFAGRKGYIYVPYVQLMVKKGDKYFKPFQKEAPVIVNQAGKNVNVGELDLNQEYPILDVIPGFIRIKYGNGYAYVRTDAVTAAAGSTIKNLNVSFTNSNKVIRTYRTLEIYDNTSGSLVEFARLNEGQFYPYIKQTSTNWMMVDLAGRTGYIFIPHAIVPLTQSDKFFKTVYADTPVIVNNNQNPNVAVLKGGQEFPIIGQIPDFVKIQYGNGYAYVRTNYVSASSGKSIQNLTVGTSSPVRQLTAAIQTPIYDNTSGKLVEFGLLGAGTSYPVIQETSRYWVKVNFGGRTGYVYKPRVSIDFKSSDQYFQPLEKDVPVYVDQNGANVLVATLKSEQKYQINSQISGFIRIMYGNGYAYVKTCDVYPTDGTGTFTFNTGLANSYQKLKNDKTIEVYANPDTTSTVIATFEPGQEYPVIKQTSSDWLQISLGNRIGYVSKSLVNTGIVKVYLSTNYNYTLDDMFQKQWVLGPQTDASYDTYVSASYITLNSTNSGQVNQGPLNVRGGPDTSYWVVGQLAANANVTIIGKTGSWYQIKYPVTWKNASPEDIQNYIDPSKATKDTASYYQFLNLSESAGLDVDEVNSKILAGKGILANEAKAFIDGALTYHVNEIYLISHALLETGNGTSSLANGILVTSVDGKPVTPKVVYNMFGIGAFDSCANQCGAETAYKQGWFTPEAAIIGGAEFIGDSYINDPKYQQDTLYKMRWNPAAPATHQYATDVGWAYKQTAKIFQLYSLLDNYQISFDVPVFLQ
jgi:mannosyl-glycoprotein endo-beta-N-acetylglucosaminidase